MNRISKDILNRANEILKTQPITPKSPGRIYRNKICLCAGAAIAAAGIESKFGATAKKRFEIDCTSKPSKMPILNAFEKLGYPAELAKNAIALNDNLPASKRYLAVQILLQA